MNEYFPFALSQPSDAMSDARSSNTPLRAKIENASAVVGVIGLGYVGLPLLRAFFQAGFPVLGFDIDQRKIDALKAGRNYLHHLGDDFVREMGPSSRCSATADFSRLGEADVVISCVPTPLGAHLEPDLSFVEKSADDIAKTLRKGQLIVLESSTYPRTTREVMLPRFEARGMVCGQDFFLAYSPEREDPGRKDHNTQSIPKLVGGIDPISGELATLLYRKAIAEVIPVSTAEVAEAAKILENVYRAVNIALVNEMKTVLTAMGIDVWEVIAAASTKPFGFQAFYPGPGLGGHCIPIDPFYLSWKARESDFHTRFIELAGEINEGMPRFVVQSVSEALNKQRKALNGSKILVLGVAYKRDIDDLRESPSLEIIELLKKEQACVDYNDPYFPVVGRGRHYDLGMECTALDKIPEYDCVLIVTDHSDYDYAAIVDAATLVVDTRNATRGIQSSKIVHC